MLIIKHTVETDASPNEVWKVMQDVEDWNKWDHGTEFSRLDGPFQVGTTGSLKPVGGPILKTILKRVEPLKLFVQEAELFLSKVVMTHSISQSMGKTQVTFQTEICGPMAFFYVWWIGSKIKEKVPDEMERFISWLSLSQAQDPSLPDARVRSGQGGV